MRLVEEVFVTEGPPNETFVRPPNFNEIFLDVRHPGKPVVIEGQSGTGKTTTVLKIQSLLGSDRAPTYLSARKTRDVEQIAKLAAEGALGFYIIDDFHRLSAELQTTLADLAKIAAEEGDPTRYPKLVIIGINEVGSGLIQFVPDIAKRCGIHRIAPANEQLVAELVEAGCKALVIKFVNTAEIFRESRGDYWLTQQLCQTSCALNDVLNEQEVQREITFDTEATRAKVVEKLRAAYHPAIKEFCRGRRFRPSNDPYFKLLRAVSQGQEPVVDLTELANSNEDVRGSINNIKDVRLANLLASKEQASRYFFYAPDTQLFAIEDPAVFYYLKHLNWDALRIDCGFRDRVEQFDFDIAISFSGENRELARYVDQQLTTLDVRVFYDENFEANYLGKTWTAEFMRIFGRTARYVLCLLDVHHREKIWPTFEREVFTPRVARAEVIPVFLDDTPFLGIPHDVVGIDFKGLLEEESWRQRADEKIVFKVIDRID
jgi:hypothetical protein